jgi:hypothetical protein
MRPRPQQSCMTEYLYTVWNPNTETRHAAKGWYKNPVCGALPHSMKYDKSPMLGRFPEDFGLHPDDCPNCARMVGEEHVVEE